ncbi:MAG: F0F1 ATP synthase subunit B [Fimbriimonadaceae bacterium]
MSRQQNGSAAKTLLVLIFGLGLAVAGFYISKEVKIDFQEKLVEQGIPLDLGKTVSMIGMFIVLFPLLNMFYFKPLSEAIHGRTAELERTFVEAEELRAEMTGLRSDYERRLAETEASAREQIQSQIREAQALRQNLMAEAASKADEMVKKAQQEIEQEKYRVMAELRLAVVDLTLSATEKVLGENVDSEKNRRLVKDFIDKVEVPT